MPLYLTWVQLEHYGVQSWTSHSKRDIKKSEKVQHRPIVSCANRPEETLTGEPKSTYFPLMICKNLRKGFDATDKDTTAFCI